MNSTPTMHSNRTTDAIAIILGIIFLLGAFSKIGDLAGFHRDLEAMKFLPAWIQRFAVVLIPGIELTLGACLITRRMLYEASMIATVLFSIFLLLSLYTVTYGNSSSCNCFKGLASQRLNAKGWPLVMRDLLLLCSSIFLISRTMYRGRPLTSS